VIGGNISKANLLFGSSLKRHAGEGINIVFCEDTEECILTGAAYIAKEESSNVNDHISTNNVLEYDMDAVVEKLSAEKNGIIDGNATTHWEAIRHELHVLLSQKGRRVFWYDINACLKSDLKAAEMPDKRNLPGIFDRQKIAMLHPDPAADLCIVYGTGAALCNWTGASIDLDEVRKERCSVV
jgi:hypothetical protein